MTPSWGIGRLALLLSTAVIAEAAGPQLEFEVASIKPTDPMGRGQFQVHPGGTLDFRAVSLRLMILWAYDIRDFQLSGGPAWTASDRPDVMAKTAKNGLESETASKTTATEAGTSVTDPIRLRLQALLADRTGLTGDYDLHMEFAPEAQAPKPGEAVASEPTGRSFMKALQEQLGLKLETKKGAGGVSGD